MGTLINTGINYRVREGDSLFSIATRFFSSVPHILSVNPDIDHGILYTISNTLATQHILSVDPDIDHASCVRVCVCVCVCVCVGF
jgi:hypothetical protein